MKAGTPKKSKRINSRRKGAEAEVEFAHFLTERGITARRGQQFRGGHDSPDIICEDFPIHFEVKRCQQINLHKVYEKAYMDTPMGQLPCIAHRKNGEKWLITMNAQDAIYALKGYFQFLAMEENDLNPPEE